MTDPLAPLGWRERLIFGPHADPETVAWVIATVDEAQRILDTLPVDPDAQIHRDIHQRRTQ